MNFYDFNSFQDTRGLVRDAINIKRHNIRNDLGKGKTMALIFLNPSLRTRMSTQEAAQRLGMNVICFNSSEAWPWEITPGAVMNEGKSEHIKDAARVISGYVDLIGIRCFAGLKDKQVDFQDKVINTFMEYATVPVVNMESAVFHPLQSLTDMVTIAETNHSSTPRITLSWAPHPKALPHAVANSFTQWVLGTGYDLTICHPPGFDLDPSISKGAKITHDQREALVGSDYVYTKNWCMSEPYGKVSNDHADWIINMDKMAMTDDAHFMHCLPVRRNVVVTDDVLDGERSLIYSQAENRMYAAQAVITRILKMMA
jgi:N-succinyl-L-ornithine transcarbamylase